MWSAAGSNRNNGRETFVILADAKSKSIDEIGRLEKSERIIGDILARLNQIELNQARQQQIIAEAVAASEKAVR